MAFAAPTSSTWGWVLYLIIAALWLFTCDTDLALGGAHNEGYTHLTLVRILHDPLAHILIPAIVALAVIGWSVTLVLNRTSPLGEARLDAPDKLVHAADGLIPRNQLYLLADPRAYAACIGIWRPGIYVSAGLVDMLPPVQLRAVLAHEESHRRRRDPLRLLVWRALARRLVFVPWVEGLAVCAELRAEIRADRFACAHTAPAQLAEALLRVCDAHAPAEGASAQEPGQGVGEGFTSLVAPEDAVRHGGSQDPLGERLRYLLLPADAALPTPLSVAHTSWAGITAQAAVVFIGAQLTTIPSFRQIVWGLTTSAPLLPALPAIVRCLMHM